MTQMTQIETGYDDLPSVTSATSVDLPSRHGPNRDRREPRLNDRRPDRLRNWARPCLLLLLLQTPVLHSFIPPIRQSFVASLSAQEANVEALALVLAAEDGRRFDETTFRTALAQPDSSIRSVAAIAIGRIRDPAGLPLLETLLRDPDSLTQAAAAFAVGQLGDTAGVPALIRRGRDPAPLAGPAALELITAAARLPSGQSAEFIRSILDGATFSGRDDEPYLIRRAALESWRLGPSAPVDLLLGLVTDLKEDTRYAAVYSLARLRARPAANRLINALSDRSAPLVRAVAARALTKSYADSSGLAPETVVDLLLRATGDQDPGVRIQALRSLASFKVGRAVAKVLPLLQDPSANVQVEAVETLGRLPGTAAVAELQRIASGTKGSFARRRSALLALARLDSTAFNSLAPRWTAAGDWRERSAAAVGTISLAPLSAAPFLADADKRVVAAALQAWSDAVTGADPGLIAASRQLIASNDAAVRAIAAEALGRAAEPADVPALVTAYRLAARDSFPEAGLAALGALVAISKGSPEAATAVNRDALAALGVPHDYLIRRWAEENWPAAASSWGAAYPLETGRTLQDYRDIARRYLLGTGPGRYPHVRLEIDQLGVIELELFGPEAPLTVSNFLRLAERRFFDGVRFHRVVPNFVVQAGDPRGDGWGGPGSVIRDEINRRRYLGYVLGMALSGPDTGGSQWFITLSPQPHLDGGYTVFGKVTEGVPVLLRVTQGDLIRRLTVLP